jgi:Transposase DDE domain
MHANTFLHNLLSKSIHKSRIKLLVDTTNALIKTKIMNLSSIGRALELPIQERSGIRKIDRLLANKFFQNENIQIYKILSDKIIGNKTRPKIIVDWTKLPKVNEYALRAAMVAEGRALTIYEEVHPKAKEGNSDVQKEFLKKLKLILPNDCKPIIITDAGFKNPWFKAVLALNWDYIGRVRGVVKYDDGTGYKSLSELHKVSSKTPKYLGNNKLSIKGPILTHFYAVINKLKGRKRYTNNGQVRVDKDSKNYGRSQREPWILVSSLSGTWAAKKVIKIYKFRMTIEEGFRDLKSSKYGFSMVENRTLARERLIVWLVLAALASFLAWIYGYVAEKNNLHYQFQANSIRSRRVLSFFYLGCQVIRKKLNIPINFSEINFIQGDIYV